jgi:hypothetical protein
MVRKERDFKFDLIQELKHKFKCKKITKTNPNHFCGVKELADNLGMSLKDVLSTEHGLPRLVVDMIVKREEIIQRGRRRHRYTVIDPKMFSSEEIIDKKYGLILAEKERVKISSSILSTKQGSPFRNAKRVKLPKTTKTSISVYVGNSTTAKRNEAGHANLLRFCAYCNSLLSMSDSLNYAQVLGTLENTDPVNKRINEIRIEVLDFIREQIDKACSSDNSIVKEMVFQAVMSQIPAMFQYYNVKALTDLKIDSNHPDVVY